MSIVKNRKRYAYNIDGDLVPEGLEFGSKAYKDALKELNVGVGTPGFGLHSSRNDHHRNTIPTQVEILMRWDFCQSLSTGLILAITRFG